MKPNLKSNQFRAFPMVSSLISPQYHDDQFWRFSESADAGNPNDFNVAMVPTFAEDFEVLTFLELFLTLIMSYFIILSMPTFTALRTGLSSTRDRTLDLLFSMVLMFSQLKSKIFQGRHILPGVNYLQVEHFGNFYEEKKNEKYGN